MAGGICVAILFAMVRDGIGFNDFLTDTPKLTVSVDFSQTRPDDEAAREKAEQARELLGRYYSDWQSKYGRLRRHLKINLVPTQREIDVSGSRAEGVWAWQAFTNEEGSAVRGVMGNLYVNLNAAVISQEALIAHESSHAFLLTYEPKLLESWKTMTLYNEGLAEVFSVEYEPTPWRNWSKLLLAHRAREQLKVDGLSVYGRRVVNMLTGKARLPHDQGFFFLYVVRKGSVNLDRDLKECTNDFIQGENSRWLKENPDSFDLPAIKE